MESVATNKSYLQPMTMAELLPELSGIISKDMMQTLTAKKQPRSTVALTRTSEKNVKPLTIAEMRADILALRVPSPRKFVHPTTSAKKKTWNASVKVDNKTKSHTADGQLTHNPVRKVLNFQPKPKAIQTPRITVNQKSSETPKFPKPEIRAKKTLHLQAKNTVRVSGVCKMPETPVMRNKPVAHRMMLANKENYAYRTNVIQKAPITPVVSRKYVPAIPDTPLVNMSGSDTSFLERERQVQDIDDKTKQLREEPALENITEVSPPVSTPFKEYRNVKEFFDHSNDIDNSVLYNDNTIMCFDKTSQCKENSKREETVIVTLCDLFNKASVTNVEEPKTQLNDLLEVEKQLEHNLKMIENGIKMLTGIKESQVKSLQYVKKVIKEKNSHNSENNESNNTLVKVEKLNSTGDKLTESPVCSKPCSVIKSKSPSYKIPKKNPCLRKKILHKSMPNVAAGSVTPNKDLDKRALNMYMDMKNNEMNFLNTPCGKYQKTEIPDTPAVTSHNLQMQLNKIYRDDI